ncbi:GFA family protein [Roseisalinus antarcticus]|uniref:Glutathione-dependent formaldehyde-activating enzyme n=1 Tax=Roseisalinus antarcticus TaxID=254357 RepID=A0A1Y5TSH1_9RHOB|nr:GFA family protein [Roseisalinus antarcticus]SLN71000.1 Glutathione-dependent formaldehyde-activating enzyme [Roseisalinus antarcticus]
MGTGTMRTGGCLCGAVRFKAAETGSFGVCHCTQCQRWAGSALFGVTVPEAAMSIAGAENIGTYRSSAWASRSFCKTCGSALWYRPDMGVDGAGDYEVPIGLLDDPGGLDLHREIFIDRKPDSWTLVGDHPRLTEAETLALYGPSTEGA